MKYIKKPMSFICRWLKMCVVRTVSEAELSHLLDYLLDLACDEKILELYKRVCRSICIYIPVVLRVILTHIGKCGKRKIVIQQIFLKRKENKVFQIL